MSYRAPILFYKPQTSLIGPGAFIHVPKVAQPVQKHLPDYEVELTVVIGKPCRDVSEKDALDYVLAYTVGNDVGTITFIAESVLMSTTLDLDVIPLPSNGCLSMGLL